MKNIEDEYNKRFQDKELSNENFDVNGLWNSISNDLDASDEQLTPKPDGFGTGPGGGIIWIALLAVFFTGAYFLYTSSDSGKTGTEFLSHSDSNNDSIAKAEVNDVNADKTGSSNGVEGNQTIESKNLISSTSENSNTTLKAAVNTKTNSATQIAEVTEISTADKIQKPEIVTDSNNSRNNFEESNSDVLSANDKTNDNSGSTHFDQAGTISSDKKLSTSYNPALQSNHARLEKSIEEQGSNIPVIDAGISNPTVVETRNENPESSNNLASFATETEQALTSNSTETNSTFDIKAFEVLGELPKNNLLLQTDRELADAPLNSTIRLTLTNNQKNVNWHVGVYGGVNQAILNFSSSGDNMLAAEKNISEKGSHGSTFGIQATLSLMQKWMFRTGAEYQKIWTIFDYKDIENFTTLKPQALIGVVIDPITGSTVSENRIDTTLAASNTRVVLHNNEQSLINIPLELGFKKPFRNWNFGILGGPVLNFRIDQKGKTLNSNLEIISYQNKDSSSLLPTFGIGWRISPFLGFKMTDNIQLTLNPSWTWNSWNKNSIFDSNDLKAKTQLMQLNLGAEFEF